MTAIRVIWLKVAAAVLRLLAGPEPSNPAPAVQWGCVYCASWNGAPHEDHCPRRAAA